MSTAGALGDTPAEFARKTELWAVKIDGAGRDGLKRGALLAKTVGLASIAAAAPSLRLRNVGRSGAKLGIKFDIKGTANPTALIQATGPLQLLEHSIHPHLIVSRRAKGLGRSRAAKQRNLASALGDIFGSGPSLGRRTGISGQPTQSGWSAYAHHPGVRRSSGPWTRALPFMKDACVKEFVTAQHNAATSIFRG